MLQATWTILCQLSPWLLIGMLISGAMHVALPADFVRKRFRGVWGVVKAVAIGIPLPLCSCGVIPAGIGLKNDGADDGASVGFMISTPQTGVDSVLVSLAFFGWPFAIFKLLAALVLGLLGGWLSNFWQGSVDEQDTVASKRAQQVSQESGFLMRIWAHSFEVFRSFWIWLLVGVVISAAIEVWMPDAWLSSVRSWSWFSAMLIVLVISAPLYICATASVPLAAALVGEGFPTSAALVFLMAGPATNTSTIGAIYGRFGLRTVFIYLIVIIVGSMASGVLLDWVLVANVNPTSTMDHHHTHWLASVSAVLVLGLSVVCLVQSQQRWFGRHKNGYQLLINGLHCEGCARKIEITLRKNFGNEIERVTFRPQAIHFSGNPDDGLVSAVEIAVLELGYEVASTESDKL